LKRPQPGALAAAFLALGVAVRVSGQVLAPTSEIRVPSEHGWLAELDASLERASGFVDRNGAAERFPGVASFALGVVRVSYSPIARWAAGIEAPYRYGRYDAEEGLRSPSARGLPGFGIFLEWAATRDSSPLAAVLRVGYFRSRDEKDQVVTSADGIDRAYAVLDASPRSRADRPAWYTDAQIRVASGTRVGDGPRLFELGAILRSGPRVLRAGQSGLFVEGLAAFRFANSAVEEANFFHNRAAQSLEAGVVLDLRPFASSARGASFRIGAARSLRSRNSLEGWRIFVSTGFGF
jgi:hypothetical protein